ncbi:AAA family ATPase [Bosea sp. 2KB_26]|uniref:AAA family ATPase n=1 Tax=Bosea sp. 2KB_26 TaxID=3237475 RepID=UPI003F92F521
MADPDLIIHINGWPGCGKLTIGRELAKRLGARLLDNHLIINPAEALFDRGDPLNHSLRKALRSTILADAAQMKPGTPLILTDALSDDAFDAAVFDEYRSLAAARRATLVAVVLDCSPERNAERLVAGDRAARHKLTAPMVLASLRANYRLLRAPGLPLVELDVSDLAPEAAAAILAERCRSALELGRGNAERAR